MKRIITTIVNLPRSVISYIRATLVELRKMEWLSSGKVVRYALIVVLITAILTVIILAMDTVFSAARDYILKL